MFRFSGSGDHAINLGPLTSPFWLTATRGPPIERGRYVVDFEQLSDDHGIFRLDKGRKDDYFKSGLYIEITPARSYTQQEVDGLADVIEKERREIERETRVNSPELPCYRYQVVRVAGGEEQLAFLDSCDPKEFVP